MGSKAFNIFKIYSFNFKASLMLVYNRVRNFDF